MEHLSLFLISQNVFCILAYASQSSGLWNAVSLKAYSSGGSLRYGNYTILSAFLFVLEDIAYHSENHTFSEIACHKPKDKRANKLVETHPIWYNRWREQLHWEALVLLLLQHGYLISGSKGVPLNLTPVRKTMDQRWWDWKKGACGKGYPSSTFLYGCSGVVYGRKGWRGKEGMIMRKGGRWGKRKRERK